MKLSYRVMTDHWMQLEWQEWVYVSWSEKEGTTCCIIISETVYNIIFYIWYGINDGVVDQSLQRLGMHEADFFLTPSCQLITQHPKHVWD